MDELLNCDVLTWRGLLIQVIKQNVCCWNIGSPGGPKSVKQVYGSRSFLKIVMAIIGYDGTE